MISMKIINIKIIIEILMNLQLLKFLKDIKLNHNILQILKNQKILIQKQLDKFFLKNGKTF